MTQVRDDVAAMLRDGATYAQIQDTLHVRRHVISTTRKALGISLPPGRQGRRTDLDRAPDYDRAVQMLRDGATYNEVRAELGLNAGTISRLRKEHNIPVPQRQRVSTGRTVEQTFDLYAEAYGDGHLRWTGPVSGRTRVLSAHGTNLSAPRVAFRMHHGREPVGYVKPNCDEPDCMAGAHLTDRTIRAADTVYASILGSNQ